jgi:sugar-phosphatase
VTAVLFDLDGVLVDSARVVERVWRRWAAEQAVPVEELLAVIHGRPGRDVVRMLAPHLDVEEQARAIGEWEAAEHEDLAEIPDARVCVAVAQEGPWAVVTSGGRKLAGVRLQTVGIPIPRVMITADDITFGKPHPEPYERAARALGVPASVCVVVEDAPAGIAAAKAAGMTVLAVATTHHASDLAEADEVFGSMREVAERLRRVRPA